ncbi:MAG: L-histidine N(alpha)-methyltransferase [Actinobacteria bacterium]|nr:L-histidine N(alpha)-methyltransferase [Actinomycetota bacterium]
MLVLLDDEWARRSLVDDVRSGLAEVPRSLSPHWLYDDRGSDLFDQITRLPEYYPTECEREILAREASSVVSLTGADVVVELGSGTSDKTRTLLDAFHAAGRLSEFIALDVSEQTLRTAVAALGARYPDALVRGIVGDFNQHLGSIPHSGRRMIAFLGGTIGNYTAPARREFLAGVSAALEPGEHLLLGVDLVKPRDRLIAAYHDEQGLTEAFIRNALDVVNNELGANFVQDRFEYICLWDETEERVDMRLRSRRAQRVSIPGADLVIEVAAGEDIGIEISTKFRAEGLGGELAAEGLAVVTVWTDANEDFALVLARRVATESYR